MTLDTDHLPTPAFREHLEWEILRAARREARFGARRAPPTGRLRVAAVVVACLALGIAGNFASAQVRDGTRRDSLLDAARAELTLLTMRVDLARANQLLARQRLAAGAASSDDFATADLELRLLQSRMARAQLDIAEIQASALPARDDLNAPRVGDRDFVTERIALDLNQTQQALTDAERARSEIERRVRTGSSTELELTEAQVKVARTQADLAVVAERLALRREFLTKKTAPEALAQRLEATQAREDARMAQQTLALAKARLQVVERQRAAGAATELELMRVQVDVKERELELSRLIARIQKLGVKLEE